MEEVTGLEYSTSVQHTETSSTNMNRDHEDIEKVLAFPHIHTLMIIFIILSLVWKQMTMLMYMR